MKIYLEMESNNALQIGTASWTLLSVISNIVSEDVVKTITLAIVGAIISFTVSLLLKGLTKSKKK
jgi:hypothetical protein